MLVLVWVDATRAPNNVPDGEDAWRQHHHDDANNCNDGFAGESNHGVSLSSLSCSGFRVLNEGVCGSMVIRWGMV